MRREPIYTDGKKNLGLEALPSDWLTPKKIQNHRCPKRIVGLINKIRKDVDGNMQEAIKTNEGLVRLFIANSNETIDKAEFERTVCQQMAAFTGDEQWRDEITGNKTLTLEHHMAATRGGFSNFFNPLYEIDKLKTSLLDGTSSEITFFSEKIMPLINQLELNNQRAVLQVLNKHSPLMIREDIERSKDPKAKLAKVKEAVNTLYSLWADGSDPTLLSILKEVYRSNLFTVPDNFIVIAERQGKNYEVNDGDYNDPIINAWDTALASSFSEFKQYDYYISDKSRFGTHQGIKGLEFPRVLVILDDGEARGFLFSYDKLFGAKIASPSDISNQKNGKETSVDRTKRLFYVTCSRAEESLAIIAYSKEPNKVKEHALKQGWFTEKEIIMDKSVEDSPA